MSISISPANIPNSETLRDLISEDLPLAIKECSLIDKEAPLSGAPILAISSKDRPMFIFFDLHDAQRALMTGLSSMEKIKQQERLINRLYPQLDTTKPSVLIIMTAASIQGDYSYFQQNGSILFYTFRGLNVDNELSILIESSTFNEEINDNEPETSKDNSLIERNFIEKLENSLLSEEENTFFNEL
jgi:hypothetical protein